MYICNFDCLPSWFRWWDCGSDCASPWEVLTFYFVGRMPQPTSSFDFTLHLQLIKASSLHLRVLSVTIGMTKVSDQSASQTSHIRSAPNIENKSDRKERQSSGLKYVTDKRQMKNERRKREHGLSIVLL